jgi:predicted DCC family thiol-disulfide oxidoreductase YuxK
MNARPDFSYRSDPQVPAFDDSRPIALMDATCALCCFGARMIDRLDRSGDIRICPAQTLVGRGVLHHYGLNVDSPETWLLLEEGRVLGSFDAMIRVAERGGGLWRILALLRIVPRSLRNHAYTWIARNRYRLFGRANLCALPAPSLRARLMQDPSYVDPADRPDPIHVT